MKAVEANLLRFLQGTRQFIIPIYQRPYSWSLKECSQLWRDIVKSAKDERRGHFIGSVVYVESGIYQVSTVPRLHVIDGQQRITTISLLLAALRESLDKMKDSEITRQKINNYYLFNSEEQGTARNKLILTQYDKDTFNSIIEDAPKPNEASRNLFTNYEFFKQKIADADIPPEKIYAGIQKLLIVDISLDRHNDNPQLIFESLNATGLKLSQADLIRNFVLMDLDSAQQTEIYNNYWYPMERTFDNTENKQLFDQFMRDYLTLKTRKIPNIGQVYDAFKDYAISLNDLKSIVKDIHHFSKLYARFALLQESDENIKKAFADINALDVSVVYPFLLELCDDYEKKSLSKESFTHILKLIESYVFRRAICGIPTNSLNKTFANFTKEINKEKYLDSVQTTFFLMENYRRFPQDAEFKQQFVIKDVYTTRIRNYVLDELENHDRKERVDIEGYTIEHIMPQNESLSSEWKKELGENWKEIHGKYLHTIGNLTLTGYNSELSDKPFLEKRNMQGGFADSPIRLNRSLAKLDHWNEAELKKRAEMLAESALQIWIVPKVSAEVLQSQLREEKVEEKHSIEIHEKKASPETLEIFQHLRKHILNLDTGVREVVTKQYVAYKFETNFVDIVFYKSHLALYVNLPLEELHNPEVDYQDVSEIGHWGNGNIKITLNTKDDVEKAMPIIKQAFDKQLSE